MTPRTRRIALGLVLASLLASCAAEPETADTTSVPSTTVATTTSTTVPATTTLPAATTSTAPPTTSPLPAFPPGRESLEHGGVTWAVVLAGAETADDPALSDAIRAAEDAGYVAGSTDCDEGAQEALGQPDGNSTVSVYLESEADAQAALLAFEARGISGVVTQVTTFCLD